LGRELLGDLEVWAEVTLLVLVLLLLAVSLWQGILALRAYYKNAFADSKKPEVN
jgi:hypothetical protein